MWYPNQGPGCHTQDTDNQGIQIKDHRAIHKTHTITQTTRTTEALYRGEGPAGIPWEEVLAAPDRAPSWGGESEWGKGPDDRLQGQGLWVRVPCVPSDPAFWMSQRLGCAFLAPSSSHTGTSHQPQENGFSSRRVPLSLDSALLLHLPIPSHRQFQPLNHPGEGS